MWRFFRHILNGESKTITAAAVVLAITSLASRVMGLFRDRILAGTFGAGEQLDIYFAAFRVPDFIYNLLVLGALSAGFIPIFTHALVKGKKEDAWRIANGVLTLLAVSLIIILGLVAIFADKLVPFIAPGFDASALAQTTVLTRIMFLSPFLLGISAIIGGMLQSMRRFVVFALGPIFYNVGIILGAKVFSNWWGIEGLAWGVVLGAFLHFMIQLPAVRELGYRFQWIWAPREGYVREIMRLMVPRTLGLAVQQVNFVAMTVIASTLTVGSITIFNLANNFQGAAVGIIGISFAIAAFPTLSEAAAKEDYKDMVQHLSETTRQILLFILPATVLFLFLRAQIVRVVLGTGAFDWDATVLTADTLALFTLSLGAQALVPLLTRVFYAVKDTLTPFIIGAISVGVNIGFALWLKDELGVRGLALAFSVAATVNFVLLWVALRNRLKTLNELQILQSFYKMAVATLAMAVVIQILKVPLDWILNTQTLVGIFLQGFIAGTIGLMVYAAVGIALRSEEITLFVKSMERRFFRAFQQSESVDEASRS